MTRGWRLAAAALAAGLVLGHAATAAEMNYRKNVGEYSIYLSVMPAEILRGPEAPYDPAASPYRPPAARDTHHVTVSIFERRTGRRVIGTQVSARVAALGFSGERKPLEPTTMADVSVYGGYFPMLGRGPFRVDIEFNVPNHSRVERATFYFSHPSFDAPTGAGKGESQ